MREHKTARLLETLRQVRPAIANISVGRLGDSSTVEVGPPSEQAAVQSIIDAFDWSDAADDAWIESRQPNRAALRQRLNSARGRNAAFLAIANPNAAQVAAQVKELTEQIGLILERLAEI